MHKRIDRLNAIKADTYDELLTKSKECSRHENNFVQSMDDNSFDDDNELGRGNHYMIQKRPSIVMQEEEELEDQKVHQMNEDWNEKIQSTTESTISKGLIIDSLSPSNNGMSNDYENLFISQNLCIKAKLIKLLIIGDKECGKSTLFNSFLNIKHTKYVKTTSLEMKQTIYKASDKSLAKLELFDTYRNMIESPMFDTYMKIAHGFIVLCDLNKPSSIDFLREQMKKTIKYSTKSVFFFGNITKQDFPSENMDQFVKIIEDYHIDPKYVLTTDLSIYDPHEDIFFKEFVKGNL